jgi:hypothetical protein
MRITKGYKNRVLPAVVMLLPMLWGARAGAVVLTFDDLTAPATVTGSSYGGLTWETGNLGTDGFNGKWVAASGSFSYPHSSPNVLADGFAATLMGIGFPSPVNMEGVFVAGIGNSPTLWYSVRAHGYLGGTETGVSPLAGVTTTPYWLDLSMLANVDRIVFESMAPPRDPVGIYSLDDLTFTYIPEPAGIALGVLALGGVLLRRQCRERSG